MFRLYNCLLEHSSNPEAAARLAEEDDDRNRAAIEEFVARHG
jgi:hypothetical protein